ncbi:hypothetical protein GGR52DRAFT_140104 [Hypoxylon sp. FL1284]|nr:hypothetical protein GGR52DRAFT_140104 [Hypoxylon sp. FL1284]
MSEMLIEVRTEYTVGTLCFIARWFCRWKTARWWWDDAFSLSAWVWFTLLYSMMEYLVKVGGPAGMDEATRESFTDEQRENLKKGGISMWFSFYLFILLTWSLKGMLITFFLRLTSDLGLQRYVKIVAGISIMAFVATVLTTTLHCLPIERNWQVVPDPGVECSAGVNINIVVAVGNVLTDMLLLAVPPLLMRKLNIPFWKKIRIAFLLSLGLFVIGMSLARCILTIENPRTVNDSSMWAQREGIVGIIAVNSPVLNGLFKRETWSSQKDRSVSPVHISKKEKKVPSKFAVYKMTNFEMISKGSESELVSPGPSMETSVNHHTVGRGAPFP